MPSRIRQSANQRPSYVEYDAAGDLQGDDGTLFRIATNPPVASTPIVYNVAMGSSGVEYSQQLPDETRRFLVRARGNHSLRLAFVAGETANNYITIPGGASYIDGGVETDSVTLYLMFVAVWPLSSEVAECVVWV